VVLEVLPVVAFPASFQVPVAEDLGVESEQLRVVLRAAADNLKARHALWFWQGSVAEAAGISMRGGRKLLLGKGRSVCCVPFPKRSSLEEVPDFTGAEFGLEGIWRVVTSSAPLDEQPACHGCTISRVILFLVTPLTRIWFNGASYSEKS
jgi:hypothetical protein